jgi:hypothetical protein
MFYILIFFSPLYEKNRLYDANYVKFGFTYVIGADGVHCPYGLLWIKSNPLCNDSFKPSKLKDHFEKCHSSYRNHSISQMNELKLRFEKGGDTLMKLGFSKTEKPILMASYCVAEIIVKNKKPHILAEDIIKPCMIKITDLVPPPIPEKNFLFCESKKKISKKSKDRSCNATVYRLGNLLTLLSSTMCLVKG